MGNVSNKIKQQWNSAHYAQVKISVEPCLATNFKKACASSNISMAAALSQFMRDYSGTAVSQNVVSDYSTRRKRRAAINRTMRQLLLIKDAEIVYLNNIPDNLQASMVYDRAEQSVLLLEEAIDLLESAY